MSCARPSLVTPHAHAGLATAKQPSLGGGDRDLPRWPVAFRGSAERLRDGFKGGVCRSSHLLAFQQRDRDGPKIPEADISLSVDFLTRGGRAIAVGDGAKPMGPTRGESRGRESLGSFSMCQSSSPCVLQTSCALFSLQTLLDTGSCHRSIVLLLSWGAKRPSHSSLTSLLSSDDPKVGAWSTVCPPTVLFSSRSHDSLVRGCV